MNAPAKLMTLIATTSLLLTACGSSGQSFENASEALNKLNEGINCSLENGPRNVEAEDGLVAYSLLECEVTGSLVPDGYDYLEIRVAEDSSADLEELYTNSGEPTEDGGYSVVHGKNWVVLQGLTDDEQMRPVMEKVQETLGGELISFEKSS